MSPDTGDDRSLVDRLRVGSGGPTRLKDRDAGDRLGLDDKHRAHERVETAIRELDQLLARLGAENTRAVLLVLQGMDTSGKDGTIRRVLTGLNPQLCQVTSFKAPGATELSHDYLWRVHADCPPRGRLGVFNRSHYEDVLAARFTGVVSHAHCRLRYRHLREFERMLTDEGTTVVKVFLHLSKDEQYERIRARLDDPMKNWKFEAADLESRRRWDDYLAAYEEVLTETSTDHAPWYVVPADRRWVRDVAVATLLVQTFRALDPQIPPPDPKLRELFLA
jgi:PPK2 family polyphosphate:nucleotide phosphotransferase